MKRFLTTVAIGLTAGFAVLATATASSPAKSATLVIRHQVRGCHTWSLNGGAFKPTQVVHLARGGTITIVDNDVMAHKLVQTKGPRVSMRKVASTMMDMSHEFTGPGVMAHMGASLQVTFAHPGVYTFTTRAGEDYMKGMETVGDDYVLRLTVVVS
jgi:hypothetical protein